MSTRSSKRSSRKRLLNAEARVALTGAALAAFFSACGKGPSGGKPQVGGKDVKVDDTFVIGGPSDTGETKGATLTAFTETLHPLLKERCGACHSGAAAPFFAGADAPTAFDALTKNQKVDFHDPEKSRIVQRLKADNHNCWSECGADGELMRTAVAEVAARVAENAEQHHNTPYTVTTTGLKVQSLKSAAVVNNPGNAVGLAPEDWDVKAPFEVVSDAAVKGGRYVTSKSGGKAIAAGMAESDTSLGTIKMRFDLQESGDFAVFARVITPSEQADSFFIKMNEEAMILSDLVRTGTGWGWARIRRRANGADPNSAQDHLFQLGEGQHALQIRQRETGVSIDMVVVTPVVNINLDDVQPSAYGTDKLEFDLSSILKTKAKLTIKITDLDDKSYKISEPTLVLEGGETIRLRGLYPMINGKFDAVNSTFAKVEVTTAEDSTVLSKATATVLKDKGVGKDELSLGFGILRVED